MPKIFKTLATVEAWALYICGWIAFLFPFFIGFIGKGYLWKVDQAPNGYWFAFAISIASSVAAAFWMIVRKKLDS